MPRLKPPVPHDLDVRDCPRMPLDIIKLKNSETWLVATGDEFRAALALWMAAWHQVPAGSLPDDDRILERLSESGTQWGIVREVCMRGFKPHSDGRLYHKTICDAALIARATMNARSKGGKERQRKRKLEQLSSSSVANSATSSAPTQTPSSAQAQAQGTRKERIEERESRGGAIQGEPPPRERAREAPPQAPASPEDDFPIDDDDDEPGETEGAKLAQRAFEVMEAGLKAIGANGEYRGLASDVIGWLAAGYDPDLDIIPTMVSLSQRPTFTPPRSNLRYFTAAIAEAHQRRTAEHLEAPDLPPELDRRHGGKTAAEMHADNARTICRLHEGASRWDEFVHGPPPGERDSRVPLEIAREFPGLISMLGLEYPCADEPEPTPAEEPA